MSEPILNINLGRNPQNDTITIEISRDEMREIVRSMKAEGDINKARRFIYLFNQFTRQADDMRRVADRLEGKKA
jgi:hypothetical protein